VDRLKQTVLDHTATNITNAYFQQRYRAWPENRFKIGDICDGENRFIEHPDGQLARPVQVNSSERAARDSAKPG
jgi:hypothetical protein